MIAMHVKIYPSSAQVLSLGTIS
ncbi:hypothetical protein MTBUT4_670006 [Magnetospirillum sp. UT-4]|nr:hypothetical protein MTBUT4_670006 [Magnetospirillum sp. UT-4]